ncbi:ATP-binding protein [Microbacterium sp. USTB-Y]|uniref:AAA family ATPase n=1 Tax=Microbacterium sp. USTB-Y TaxID=2823692 RepID=UPI00203DD16C|nr:ATP-binding protein [Microbacterium sp. USTB-Y]
MDFDQDDRELLRAVSGYLTSAQEFAHAELRARRTPLGDVISAHLGVDAETLPIVQESIAEHRLVDADIALELLSAESDGRLIGVTGGEQRQHQSMTEYVGNGHFPYGPGPVDYVERASGPGTTRRVVALGVRLLHFDGQPLAMTQRGAAPQFGRRSASLEVMGADSDVVSGFLAAVRARMISHSVLRGRVLSFVPTEYGQDAGATFVPRPSVAAEDVVLPDGLLDGVVQHVIGIGEHRELLRASGQHLKRGVLLYGPPGTGKTLTVRHLLTRAPDMTVVLLSGPSIRFVSAAAEVARTFQPSIVVLEDIDLVAMERNASPQPLLFEVLEALDGLDGDADVAFVMTTNRVEVLERALAERPGRVDLAVEVPRPARAERERLYRHYARGLGFGDEALRAATDATEGVTGSFAKELVRRSVLRAAERGEAPGDADLSAALAELLDARQELTRRMLGDDPGAGEGSAPQGFPPHGAY